MAVYSANRPNRTLALHKTSCTHIPYDRLSDCGCGERGAGGNQLWFCEDHVTRDQVDEFMRGRYWAIVICNDCYS